MAEFNPHRVQWTPELMERFWSFYSDERRREKAPWFSKLYGDSIIGFAKKHMSVERGMLDYGCGLGHLMEKMLEHNIEVEGLEFSREEAESVRKRLDGRKGFKGVTDVNTLPSSLEDNHAENIICVEVVEHLLDDMLEGSVREMFRLVKPGGRVMITTPHNEDLEASEIMCAECGSIFHQVQHVRSWTPESLAKVMEEAGFKTELSKAVQFTKGALHGVAMKGANTLMKMEKPHLVYIGSKPEAN